DPEAGRRAHILLLLGKGYTWDTIAAVLFTSASTIARWQQRFQAGGIAALAGRQPGRRQWFCWRWAGVVAGWGTPRSPPPVGVFRGRWACAAAARLLLRWCQLAVCREPGRRCTYTDDV